MPTENKPAVPKLDFNTPDAGRSYIAELFEIVLRRHDYRQYISERLAGDFACTLAQHFEEIKAREAALQLLNERDDQNHSLEQRRQAEQQACQAAERRVKELQAALKDLISAVRSINRSPAYKVTVIGDDEPQYRQRKEWIDWVLELCEKAAAGMERTEPVAHVCTWSQDVEIGIWNSTCGSTWSFHDDGPEENGMKFCHSCGKHLVVEVAEPEQDNDWRMNPCKQDHRDVGAAAGVAHCYTCDEKIEAANTQEAFERWNAAHPAAQA